MLWSSLRAQLAVIWRSVLDSGTPNVDCRSPSGEWLSDANGSQTGYPRIIIQNDRFRSCYTRCVQWRCQFSEITRMEAMMTAFPLLSECPKRVATAWQVSEWLLYATRGMFNIPVVPGLLVGEYTVGLFEPRQKKSRQRIASTQRRSHHMRNSSGVQTG
jgi:hypothetical protein